MQRLMIIATLLCIAIVVALACTFLTHSLYVWIPVCTAIWSLSIVLYLESRRISTQEYFGDKEKT